MKVVEFEAFIEQYPQFELLFEYTGGCDRMCGYYHFIRKDRWNRSHAQLMANLEFLLASSGAYGSRGLVEDDGDILPIVAKAVKQRMKGQKYSQKVPLEDSPSFLSKCRRLLRRGRVQDPEKQRIKKLKRLATRAEELRPKGKPLVLPVEVKPKKETPSLTYAQVEAQGKWLAREYERNRENSKYTRKRRNSRYR